MKKLFTLSTLLIFWSSAFSQQYNAEVKLPKVTANGFYQIPVTPQLARYLAPGFTNLRIFDQSNQETPYLVREEVPIRQTEKFQEYEIERHATKVSTELILKNPNRNAINNIHLRIKNADVVKEAVLLGSDDHRSWFAIKDRFSLSPIDGGNGTFEMRVLDFPTSNYLFYSLRISDSLTAPINILSAGHFEANTENGQYVEVPAKVSFTTDLKKKQSQISVAFDSLQYVDRIDLTMTGKLQYFLRRATIEESRERKLKKGKVEKYEQTISGFEVSSTHPTQINTDIRLKGFQIVINNADNPPLELSSLHAYQLNRYLVAWLSAGAEYTIKIGGENLSAPTYDLHFFSDSIPKKLQNIPVGDVVVHDKQKSPTGASLFTSKNFIWAAIIIVTLLLGYMAINLAKDVGKSKNQ